MIKHYSTPPTYPAFTDDKESVTNGSLADDILALLVAVLIQYVRNLDKSLLRQVDEGGD